MRPDGRFPTHHGRLLAGLVLVTLLLTAGLPVFPAVGASDAPIGTWTASSRMATPRVGHSATFVEGSLCADSDRPPPLPCGKVLVAGGRGATEGDAALTSSQLYDPASRAWLAAGPLVTGRSGHTATPLPDGRVLVTGGRDQSGNVLPSTELFDPRPPDDSRPGGSWGDPSAPLTTPRAGHRATLLPGGRVLVTGGTDASGKPVATAEIFEPTLNVVGAWRTTGALTVGRTGHAATLLPDGRVLVTGGTDASGNAVATAEIFDGAPDGSVGAWRAAAAMGEARSDHTATALPDGRIVVASAGSSEVFDPAIDNPTGEWLPAGAMRAARSKHTATLLEGPACQAARNCGQILVVGGADGAGRALAAAEVFDPVAGTWRDTGNPLFARASHEAVLLIDGQVLAVGGRGGSDVLADAEVFDPSSSSQPPSVTGMSPSGGSLGGNDVVTITGAGFDGAREVRFGTAVATEINVASSTQITVRSPAKAASDRDNLVHVAVTTSAGTSAPINLDLFKYAPRPIVIDVEPEAGPLGGGTEVTIRGENLDFPETAVRFGDTVATSVTLRSDTELVARSPPRSAGTIDITVVTPAGVSEPSSLTRFTYDDGTWAPATPLSTSRYHHTATLLLGGDVLVAGGTKDFQPVTGDGLSLAELYDPAKGKWRPTASLNVPRHSHTATRLPDGNVLVVGGMGTDLSQPLAEETRVANVLTPGSSVVHTMINPPTSGPAIRLAQSSSPPSGDAVTPGATITYTLAYFNTGTAPTTTVVTELLPEELVFVSATEGGTFDPVTRLVSFPPVVVPPGTTATSPAGTVSFSVTVAGVPGGFSGVISTVGRADGSESNAVEHRIFRTLSSRALVAISADPPSGSTVRRGSQITYSLAYFNPGQAARDLVVRDRLPFEAELVAASDESSYDKRTRTVTFPSVTVAPGTSAADPAGAFTVTVRVEGTLRALASAEVYDVTTGEWISTGGLRTPRFSHAATLLEGPDCHSDARPDYCGKVLVTGGTHDEVRGRPPVAPAELYDPATGTWSSAGSIGPSCAGSTATCGRTNHTATQLPDGKVLVAGGLGSDPSQPLGADVPIDNVGRAKGSQSNRSTHTAIPPSTPGSALRIMQSADPPSGSTVAPGSEITYSLAYYNTGSITANDVVVSDRLPSQVDFVSASNGGTFDPSSRTVTFPPISVAPGTSAAEPVGTLTVTVVVRSVLPDTDDRPIPHSTPISNSEFQAMSLGESVTPALSVNSVTHVFVRGPDPGAALRIMNGASPPSGSAVTPGSRITYSLSYYNTGQAPAGGAVVSDELPIHVEFVSASGGGQFNPGTRTVTFPPVDVPPGTTAATPAGTFTVTVGVKGAIGSLATAEVYDPSTNAWSATGSLTVGRFAHRETLLGDVGCGQNCGKVLITGGVERLASDRPVFTSSVELYDPVAGTWRSGGLLTDARAGHSATLLPDGTVLIAGSSMVFPHFGLPEPLASAEIYQPATGTLRDTLPMETARGIHTATLMDGPQCRAGDPPPAHCGTVLATGGAGSGEGPTAFGSVPPALDSAEIYTPPVAAPVIGSIVPTAGPSTGKTDVVVSGIGFNRVTAVNFGDQPAASFKRDSLNQITAVAPPHAKGTVDVRVTTPAGTSGFTEAAEFTYTVSRPPARITDLAVRATSGNDVTLTWSAPASDGSFPPPAGRYIVKQSTSPITDEAGFAAARSLCAEGCRYSPAAVGDRLSLSVANLGAGATYHYSIRAVNEIDLRGPMSNAASVAIPARPGALSGPGPGPSVSESQVPNPAPAAPSATESRTPAGTRRSTPGGTTVVSEAPAPSTAVTEGKPPPESPGVVVAPSDPSSSSSLESASPIPELTGEEGGFPLVKVLAWLVLMVGVGALGAFLNARYRSGGVSPSGGGNPSGGE